MIILLPLIGGIIAVVISAIDVVIKIVERILGNRFAVFAVVTSLTVALFAALVVSMDALIATAQVVIPSSITMAWSWFMPANAAACFNACATARIVAFIYQRKVQAIKEKAYYRDFVT